MNLDSAIKITVENLKHRGWVLSVGKSMNITWWWSSSQWLKSNIERESK
jgi:hypothetical protein